MKRAISRGGSRELVVYFALAYGISWVIWAPLVLGKGGLGLIPTQPSPIYLYAGFFGPTLAALISQRLLNGDWRAFRLWTSLWQMIAGMLAGSALLLLADFMIALGITQSGYSLWSWPALLAIPRVFLPNLVGGPLGEEPGWRGFAFPRLQTRLGPLPACAVLGFLWTSWHLPLYLIHFSSIPYWLYAPWLMAASVILGYGVNLSRGSAVVAIFLHGFFNVGFGVITNDFMGKAVIRPSQNTIIVASFVGVAILLTVATRGQLGAGSK
jgi:membrane protease YdiL (CAAX protease family)